MLASIVGIYAPIGAIARDLEVALKSSGGYTPDHDAAQIRDIYARFDADYQSRPDYRVWRLGITPYFAVKRPWLANIHTAISLLWHDRDSEIRQCIETASPVILWSTIAIAPELIRDSSTHDEDPIWLLVDKLFSRLKDGLQPLGECPASCGLAAAFFLARYQNLHFRAGKPFDLRNGRALLDEITRWLKLTDPTWAPGKRVRVEAIILERRASKGLRPGHPAMEQANLVGMFSVIRPMLSQRIVTLTRDSKRLQSELCDWARTAWLEARSKRLAQIVYQKSRDISGEERSAVNRRKAFLEELDALFQYTNAARDDGRYLEAAKHLYLVYRIIPDELVKDPEVRKVLGRRSLTARYIKEAGLEIDPRFSTPDRPPTPVRERFSRVGGAAIEGSGFFYMELQYNQDNDLAWKTIRSGIPKGQFESPPGYLLSVMRRLADQDPPEYASPHVLRAAFEVALRYGYVRSAGKILAKAIYRDDFGLTPALIMDFVDAVQRCLGIDPFAIRHNKIAEWYAYIRDAVYKLHTFPREEALSRKWFTSEELLRLHETILGRTHTHHRSLSANNAARLYRKAEGSYEIDDLREFYDWEYDFDGRRPSGVSDVRAIAGFCGSYADTSLGAPVLTSLLRINDLVSIVGVGRDGRPRSKRVLIPGLTTSTQALVAGSEFWFKVRSARFEKQIDWPDQLLGLSKHLRKLAGECDPKSKVIVLATEPELAKLPWQHLMFATECTPAPENALLISIAPNMSTICIDKRHDSDFAEGVRAFISVEKDLAITKIADCVRESIDRVTPADAASLCVVVGHGRMLPGQARPIIDLGDGSIIETLDQWIDVLNSRHFLLHCCHSGRVEPVFMRELGGIPGLALSLGANTFIAPVAEVSYEAAISLQLATFSKRRTLPIGVNYLRAIQHNGEVSLYNIYGNPYEVMLPSNSPRSASQPHGDRHTAGTETVSDFTEANDFH